MNKIAIALLATTVLGTPAVLAASNNQQHPQGQQMQQSRSQSGQNAKDRQGPQSAQQQSAENSQPISSQNLSRSQLRRVQQALDKEGFKAGRADGRWGHETQSAVKQFQQSKQLRATGQLDQQTVADLGLDASHFSQSKSQQK